MYSYSFSKYIYLVLQAINFDGSAFIPPFAVTGSTAFIPPYAPLKFTCIRKPGGSAKISFSPPSAGLILLSKHLPSPDQRNWQIDKSKMILGVALKDDKRGKY